MSVLILFKRLFPFSFVKKNQTQGHMFIFRPSQCFLFHIYSIYTSIQKLRTSIVKKMNYIIQSN